MSTIGWLWWGLSMMVPSQVLKIWWHSWIHLHYLLWVYVVSLEYTLTALLDDFPVDVYPCVSLSVLVVDLPWGIFSWFPLLNLPALQVITQETFFCSSMLNTDIILCPPMVEIEIMLYNLCTTIFCMYLPIQYPSEEHKVASVVAYLWCYLIMIP